MEHSPAWGDTPANAAAWAWNAYYSARDRLFPALVASGVFTQGQAEKALAARLLKAQRLEALVSIEPQLELLPERDVYHG